MSKDLNQCNFIGRLGQDVELKYTPAGKAVANISIACGDDYKNKDTGEKVEQTNWVRVVAFGRLAEVIGEFCHKGSRIFVSGKQVTRKWQDQNGQDRYSTEIVASEMQLLDSKSGQQDTHNQAKSDGYQPQGSDFNDNPPF